MRANALIGLILVLVIIVGVFIWAVVGQPLMNNSGTATTTPTVNTGGNTGENGGSTGGNGGTGVQTAAELAQRVVVDAPKQNATVPKNFSVTGKAPGPWFFEASFPIEVRNASGTVVATGIATALSDWMTTADVPFKADIVVNTYKGPATLVLKRDNPSGLPQNDASKSMSITIQ